MPRRAIIQRRRRVFDDFFKIDELLIAHEKTDGTMSAVQSRLVFERGDSVAVLLFHVERKSVLLVEQFRAPALLGRRRDDPTSADGWIVETVAGMIDGNEAGEAAAIRETSRRDRLPNWNVATDRQVLLFARRQLRAHISIFCRGARR